ncbi:PHP domain-containing protein [Methanosarcina sp. KYL-1]|uniref:PHP domain-containing protein n=1 Tax=Methanosarcina sp. KYL-1 TaxID=2602068 RepID=UPI002100C4DD|nr:PHP domain-containing protein [Methanosarcina sp. KYL-1]MCQ1536047.1 PHP domain-containing protein [Methanosarcina sp. KYL-1]
MGERQGNYTEKLITPERAAELMEEGGWKRADLHVHTNCSFDVLPAGNLHPEKLYEKALGEGLDFITFTDHDTVEAYEILGWEREKLVTGIEMMVHDPEWAGHTLHVNVFDLDREEFEELREIAEIEHSLKSFVHYLKKNRLPFIYNHPFWFEFHQEPNPSVVPGLAKLFPVLEYNMHEPKLKNELTISIAETLGKGIVATTDSHTGKFGQVYTLAKGESFREYFRNIEKGRNYIVTEDLTREFLIEEMNTWIDLIFEKSRKSQEIKTFLTGIKSLDTMVRLSRSALLNCFPGLNRTTMNLLYMISNTGLPASFYLHSEENLAREIEKQIENETWK